MATTSTSTSSTVTQIAGYCIVAEARCGDNGAAGGAWEVGLGGAVPDGEVTRRTWDANGGDGYDSALLDVVLSAEVGGGTNGVSWSVGGATDNPIVYTGRTYGAIQKVKVRAGVRLNASARWSNLSVKFYRAGRSVDGYGPGTGPVVDTTSAAPPGEGEQVLEVVPNTTTATKVTVSGKVRLTWPSGTVPNPDDVFVQVYVFADSCASA